MLGLGIALFSSAVPGLLFSAALALHLYAGFNLLQAALAVSAGALIVGGMLIGLSARRLSSARSQLTAPLKELRLNLGALSGADE